METFTGEGHEVRTVGGANLIRLHSHYGERWHWRKAVLFCLALADEFFAGRFHCLCDTRTILENRWGNYID